MIHVFSVLFITLFFIFPAMGETCLSDKDVEAITTQFQFEQSTSESVGAEKWIEIQQWNSCETDTLIYKAVQSIIELKRLQGFVESTNGYEQGVLRGSPFRFLKERVQIIRFDINPKSQHCKASVTGVMAYVLDSYSNIMYMCPFLSGFSPLEIQGTLIHEARHLLQNEKFGNEKEIYAKLHGSSVQAYAHRPCLIGFFINTPSCDVSPEVMGSYGVEMEFYLQIAQTESLPAAIRDKALGHVIDGYLGHFNNIPGGSLGLLLLTETGSLIFYEPEKNTYFEVMNDIPSTSVVTDRFTPTFFDLLSGSVNSFLTPTQLVKTNGSFAESFRQLPIERIHQVRDVVYGTDFQCLLFADSVFCSGGDEGVTMSLPKSMSPLQLSVVRGMGMDLFFIVDRDGKNYRLPTELPLAQWTAERLEEIKSFSQFRSVGVLPGLERYGITHSGRLVHYHDPAQLKNVEAVSHLKFKKMIAPFQWSKQLQDL
jgi:hypothetical protein